MSLINVELSLSPIFAINELTDERSLCKVCSQFHVDDITFDSYRGPRASDKATLRMGGFRMYARVIMAAEVTR